MATASPSQQAIYTQTKDSKDHLAIQATAGAGKSTVLLGCLNVVPRLKKTLFVSFSNAIVNELRDRVPAHVKASTLHSVGNRFIMNRFRGLGQINENKYFQFALPHYEEKNKEVYKQCFGIQDLCKYARLTLCSFNEPDLSELAEKYTLDVSPEQVCIASIILQDHSTLKGLQSIDYTDMIYLPAVYPELVNETYDYVFWDEAQDAGKAQMKLIENIIKKPNGRLIFCGDEKQAIFGFIGSDVDSFNQIEKKFGSKRMSLTVTYRCAKKIVELAQSVYPEVIEAWEGSPDGIVRKGDLMEADEGDMVICRNTKPLIAAFFDFIKYGKKAYVVGKDYEKGLISLAETVSGQTIERVQEKMELKLNSLLEQLIDDGAYNPESNPKYVALLEKCNVIQMILQRIDHPSNLTNKIREIFHEDKKAIRLLTAHRSKGLECERVFFIEHFNGEKLLPSKYAILPWQKTQENNLLFVVYTRAKREFVFVDYKNN